MKKLKANLKTVLAVWFIIGLVGCSVRKEDINVAISTCKDNGGIEWTRRADFGATLLIGCENGAVFNKTAD